MFESDRPIESCSEDLLGRADFAKSLAQAIRLYTADESLVIGLYGEWGAGKTSIINCAVEHLGHSPAVSRPKSDEVILVRFNPWNFSDQNQLYTQFFKHLSFSLGKQDYSKKAKKAGQTILAISQIVGAFSIVPMVGELLVKPLSRSVKELGKGMTSLAEALGKDLEELKNKVATDLRQQPNKILIIVDDIDRLSSQETRQIFQMIKSLADFPKTVYLLAFDKKVVMKTLQEVQKGSAEDYLAKIVPVCFDVPSLDKTQLKKLLGEQLKQLINETVWQDMGWDTIYDHRLHTFFRNIRDVNRFLNTFQFILGLLKDEVDVGDLLTITAVQTRAPRVYDGIRDNRRLFLGPWRSNSWAPSDVLEEEDRNRATKKVDEILDGSGEFPKDVLQPILRELFPQLEQIYGKVTGLGRVHEEDWRKERRICSEYHFDTYFRFSPSGGRFSKREIDETLALYNSSDDLLRQLLRFQKEGRMLTFFDDLEFRGKEAFSPPMVDGMVEALVSHGDELCLKQDDPRAAFNSLRQAVLALIRIHETFDERMEAIRGAIGSVTKGIYTPFELIREIKDEHRDLPPEHLTAVNPELHPRHVTLRREDLDAIKALISDKIWVLIRDGSLLDHQLFVFPFKEWAEWQTRERVSEAVGHLAGTGKLLASFVSGFVQDQGSSRRRELYIEAAVKDLSAFFDLKDLQTRLRQIVASSEIDDLAPAQARDVKDVLSALDSRDGSAENLPRVSSRSGENGPSGGG